MQVQSVTYLDPQHRVADVLFSGASKPQRVSVSNANALWRAVSAQIIDPGFSGTVVDYVEPEGAAAARIAATKQAVITFADGLAEQITGPVPAAEKDGWDAKARAAISYLAAVVAGDTHAVAVDKTDPVGRILIDAEVALTGEDWPTISAQIKAQAEFYALVSGKIAAVRRTTMAAIDAVGESATQEQLDAVVASAKSTAETEFAAVMAQAQV